jgi:hypothetical protein
LLTRLIRKVALSFAKHARLLSLKRNEINKIRFVAFAHFSPSQERFLEWRGVCPSWSCQCAGMFERYGVMDGKICNGPLAWGGAVGHGREAHHLGGGVRQEVGCGGHDPE